MYNVSQLIVTVHPIGILFAYGISISRVVLSVKGTLPWWLTTEHRRLQFSSSLVWDSRLVPWIHYHDGDIQVSPIANHSQQFVQRAHMVARTVISERCLGTDEI